MAVVLELEGAKAVKALAAAKAEGFKAGAAAAKGGAAKATAVKVAAAKTSTSGILSGGAPACHLGLGLGLGVWGPVLAVAALCAATGACVYWCAKRSQIRQKSGSQG